MAHYVLIFDLETVPDLSAIARAHGLDEADEAGAREALGKSSPNTRSIGSFALAR
jgi:3'-5' exonuclease